MAKVVRDVVIRVRVQNLAGQGFLTGGGVAAGSTFGTQMGGTGGAGAAGFVGGVAGAAARQQAAINRAQFRPQSNLMAGAGGPANPSMALAQVESAAHGGLPFVPAINPFRPRSGVSPKQTPPVRPTRRFENLVTRLEPDRSFEDVRINPFVQRPGTRGFTGATSAAREIAKTTKSFRQLNKSLGGAITELILLATWSRAITRVGLAIRGAGALGAVPAATGAALGGLGLINIAPGGRDALRTARSGRFVDTPIERGRIPSGRALGPAGVLISSLIGGFGELAGRAPIPTTAGGGLRFNRSLGRGITLRELGTGINVGLFGGDPTGLSGPQQARNRQAQALVGSLGPAAARALSAQQFTERRALLPITTGLNERLSFSNDRIGDARNALNQIDRLPTAQTPEGRLNRVSTSRQLLSTIFEETRRQGREQIDAEQEKTRLLQRQVELERRKSDILSNSILTGQQRSLLRTRGERAREQRAFSFVERTGLLPPSPDDRRLLFEGQGLVGTQSRLGVQLRQATERTFQREVGGTAVVADLELQRRAHEDAIIRDELFGEKPNVQKVIDTVKRGLNAIIQELSANQDELVSETLDTQQAVRDRELSDAARSE